MTVSGWCTGPPGSKPDQFHEGCRVENCSCPNHVSGGDE